MPLLDLFEPRLIDFVFLELLVQVVEVQHMHLGPVAGIFDYGAGLHDERPVARLRQHQFARRLVETAATQFAAAVGVVLGQLDHPLRAFVEMAVDPVILGEVRFGILLLRRGKKRARLERWFDAGVRRLHCVPWEAETGLKWAQLLASLRASGRSMPIKDSLIAATALVHDLVVVTRNRPDFEKAGVSIIDPHNLPFNQLAPPVQIEQITADRKAYDMSSNVRLPPLVRDLEIDYTALSLIAP